MRRLRTQAAGLAANEKPGFRLPANQSAACEAAWDPHEKADMWSAGVIFYILLCGFPPYEAQYNRSEKAPHRNNGRGELDYGATYASILPQCDADGRWAYFPSPYWDRVSREARRLLQTMLCLDPQARASAEVALRDPWYQILRTTDTTDAVNGAGVSASAGGGGQPWRNS